MGSVIKQSEFVSIQGSTPPSVLIAPQFSEVRLIDNGEREKKPEVEKEEPITEDSLEARAKALKEKEALCNEKIRDFEVLKQQYIDQGEKLLNDARAKAADILEDAEIHANLLKESAEKESVEIRKTAEDEGYKKGFEAGEVPGYNEGFSKATAKCQDALTELKNILDKIPSEKEQIFKDYENRLFDLIFSISNKITVGSLKQKDKAVISKMLKEAAKNFRNSTFIKVTLSKLDIDESANVDLDDFTRIFGVNQHIEFEILKDAPKGTLILDNGSEITDAGVLTQLKMIENLGKGKFKNRPDDLDEDEEDASSEIEESSIQ